MSTNNVAQTYPCERHHSRWGRGGSGQQVVQGRLGHEVGPTVGLQRHVSGGGGQGSPTTTRCRNRVPGAGSREHGAGREQREHGTGSREQGAGSREQGAGSREQGVGSRQQGTGSREQASREQAAGSRQQVILEYNERLEYGKRVPNLPNKKTLRAHKKHPSSGSEPVVSHHAMNCTHPLTTTVSGWRSSASAIVSLTCVSSAVRWGDVGSARETWVYPAGRADKPSTCSGRGWEGGGRKGSNHKEHRGKHTPIVMPPCLCANPTHTHGHKKPPSRHRKPILHWVCV
jgi:hypothetical protein